jgi:kynureninase
MADVTLAEVRAWDKRDPLRSLRDAFALPPGLIYLDGNSLGPLPHDAARRMADVVAREWGVGLIRSWEDASWMAAPARVGGKIARLIGAHADEAIVADSTSVNLFKLLGAALALRPGRTKVLTEQDGFPTDRHVAEGLARLVPHLCVEAVPASSLLDAIDDTTAVLLLCHVHFRSGARHDMAALTAAAHRAGALTVWDLSHSAGAIPVDLNGAGADMAVGCGYKFLNGGPGSPAFLFVARHLQAEARSPLQGWIGHAAPFGFSDRYEPAAGISRFLTGTPPVLGLAALEAGVDLMLTADMGELWKKSARLFDLFASRVAAVGPRLELLTPLDAELRGSHIAFRCADAAQVMRDLIGGGTIGDFRPPDVLRFGLTPLYTRFEDVWLATASLRNEG